MLVCPFWVLRMVMQHLNQFVTFRVQVELDVILRVLDVLAEGLELVAGVVQIHEVGLQKLLNLFVTPTHAAVSKLIQADVQQMCVYRLKALYAHHATFGSAGDRNVMTRHECCEMAAPLAELGNKFYCQFCKSGFQ